MGTAVPKPHSTRSKVTVHILEDIYGKVPGHRLRAIYVPGTVFPVQRALLSPFSEAASDIMGLNWLVCYDTPYETKEVASTFGVQSTRAEDFLRLKATLPRSQQPAVASSTA